MSPTTTSDRPRRAVHAAGAGHDRNELWHAADHHWRRVLVQQIDARPHDIVADVGCGAGELAVMLKLDSPAACVYGLDPDPFHLNASERRAFRDGATVHFMHATLDDARDKLASISPTRIVCSNVLGHLPFHRRHALVAAIYASLPPAGVFYVADAGWHRLSDIFMRFSRAHADNVRRGILSLLRNAGFADCMFTSVVPAGIGHVSLFRGVKS